MVLQEEATELPTPTGPMRTHVFRPVAPGRYPALLLYSEIYQLTGPVRRAAALLAGHGFVVAAPEIYHELEPPGSVLGYDPEGTERGNRHKVTKPVSAHDADARSVIDWLLASPHATGAVGTIGICIGGHLALRAATNPEVLAAACFYATDVHKGSLGLGGDDTLARIPSIRGELLLIWGRQDPHIPWEGRRLVQERLHEAGTRFTWHEFNGAHAFIRDEGHRYDPELALECYRLVLDLFRRRLGEGDRRT